MVLPAKADDKRLSRLLAKTILSSSGFLALMTAQQAHAQRVISACSGVSLPRSVVTGIVAPVITGVTGPIESTVNGIIALPLLGIGLPNLNTNATGLLTQAASGNDITLQALASDGNIIGPSDQCRVTSDSITLDTPAGVAIGGNQITGLGANGAPAFASDLNAIAFGNNARAEAGATGSLALGTNTSVSAANSVALGTGSIAARGALSGYTATGLVGPQSSAGEVSIGAPGATRQLTNVAAGTAATDAATVGQVNGVAGQLAALDAASVRYDGATRSRITLAGATGTTIGNLTPGAVTAASTEAVNGAQLFATNQNVGANTTAIAGLDTRVTTNTTALAALDAAAVRYDAADRANVTFGGATGTVLNNVAPGALTAGSVQAVNGSQLFATNTQVAANTAAITGLGNGAAGVVRYSSAGTPTVPNGGTVSDDATLVGAGGGAVGLHNVRAGALVAGGTDAVNGGQLFATNQAVGANTSAIGALDGRVTTVEGQIGTLTTNVAGNTSAITNLQTGLATTNTNVANNTAAIGNLQTGLTTTNTNVANNTTAIGNLQTGLATTNTNVANNTSAITNLQTGLTTTNTNVANLTAQVGTNTTAITDLQTGLAGTNTTVANLTTQVAGNTSTISNLTTQVGGNSTAITNLQNSVAGTNATVTNLSTQVAGNTTAIANVNIALANQPLRYANAGTPTTPNGGVVSNDATLAGANAGPVGLHNVRAGAAVAGSTDAVNGDQLATTNAQVATNTAAITNLGNFVAGSGISPVQYSNPATPTTPNGGTFTNDVTIVGATPGAPVGVHNVAAGTVAAGSTDVTNGGQLYATDQIARQAAAVGANSVQYDAGGGSVTFGGNSPTPIRLSNIAPGVSTRDAVNVGQLQASLQGAVAQANGYTDARLSSVLQSMSFDLASVRREIGAGTSAALAAAGLPQANEPGRSMIAIGGGTYRGQTAIAFGASTFLNDGHSILRLGATYDSRGYGGANAGFGYQF